MEGNNAVVVVVVVSKNHVVVVVVVSKNHEQVISQGGCSMSTIMICIGSHDVMIVCLGVMVLFFMCGWGKATSTNNNQR